jgi:DNA polymerase-3 subunit delta
MQSFSLDQNPASLYLLSGDEPLLLRDWLDSARDSLKQSGFEDIQSYTTDISFDWDELLQERAALSLFAEKKCRVIRIPNGKPGQQGSKIIQALCDDPQDDTIFIFVIPKLDRASKNSSWFKRLQQAGEIVELKPVYSNQLVDWIVQRAGQKSLSIDTASAAFLAERTEGNLLAADQELEKLSIRFSEKRELSFEVIEESVAQSSRYNNYVLVDACLAGNPERAMKVLNSLIAEGYVTAQLLWALQSALQQLTSLKQSQVNGRISQRLWQELRIWSSKQRLFETALSRLSLDQIERLIQSCATLDRIGKGQQDAEFPHTDWLQMKSMVCEFCGIKPLKTMMQE